MKGELNNGSASQTGDDFRVLKLANSASVGQNKSSSGLLTGRLRMYEISKGFDGAVARWNALHSADFHREAFIFSAISFETTIYRIARSSAKNSGMDREIFEDILGHGGFKSLDGRWKFLDPERKSLIRVIKDNCGQDLWNKTDESIKLRNLIAHGKSGCTAQKARELGEALWEVMGGLRTYAKVNSFDDPFSRAPVWKSNGKSP